MDLGAMSGTHNSRQMSTGEVTADGSMRGFSSFLQNRTLGMNAAGPPGPIGVSSVRRVRSRLNMYQSIEESDGGTGNDEEERQVISDQTQRTSGSNALGGPRLSMSDMQNQGMSPLASANNTLDAAFFGGVDLHSLENDAQQQAAMQEYGNLPQYGSMSNLLVEDNEHNPYDDLDLDDGEIGNLASPPFGEHPDGEHPSRTLFVRNINANVEDEDLRKMFEEFGPLRNIYTTSKHRGFIMVSYFDIRHAKNAMRHLHGLIVRRRKIDIHYSIPKENPPGSESNQGTLVVFNLDESITDNELLRVFNQFGEVKEIRETPNKRNHRFIEFYDVRNAEAAMLALNKSDFAGKRIHIEASRPGGIRRQLASSPPLEDPTPIQQNKNPTMRIFQSPSPSPPPNNPSAVSHLAPSSDWYAPSASPRMSSFNESLRTPSWPNLAAPILPLRTVRSTDSLLSLQNSSGGTRPYIPGVSLMPTHSSPNLSQLAYYSAQTSPHQQQQNFFTSQSSPNLSLQATQQQHHFSQQANSMFPSHQSSSASTSGQSFYPSRHSPAPQQGYNIHQQALEAQYANEAAMAAAASFDMDMNLQLSPRHLLAAAASQGYVPSNSVAASLSNRLSQQAGAAASARSQSPAMYPMGMGYGDSYSDGVPSQNNSSSHLQSMYSPLLHGGASGSHPALSKYHQLASALGAVPSALGPYASGYASGSYSAASSPTPSQSMLHPLHSLSLAQGMSSLSLQPPRTSLRTSASMGHLPSALTSFAPSPLSDYLAAEQNAVPHMYRKVRSEINLHAHGLANAHMSGALSGAGDMSGHFGGSPIGSGPMLHKGPHDRSLGDLSRSGMSTAAALAQAAGRHSHRKVFADNEDKSQYIIDYDRIRACMDKRTTCMIRNIPNKYSQKMLLSAVDERFKGLYDFFYLPIDFKNKCNVGYAFVNFINYVHIVDFVEQFGNKKWDKFNSEKVCQITYARIQGKSALIAHFQNSSLMCEDKKCRPIIFHSEGPFQGEQEPFPVGTCVRRRGTTRFPGDERDKPQKSTNTSPSPPAVGGSYIEPLSV